jgi:hypothetical protein
MNNLNNKSKQLNFKIHKIYIIKVKFYFFFLVLCFDILFVEMGFLEFKTFGIEAESHASK